jgi:osmotically-inducible protein OsmY
MKPDRLLLAFLIPPVALVSTAIAGPAQPTDDNISTDVQLKLATFPGGSGILVAVKDGMVTLPGSLPTKKQRTQAEKLAKQVHGVKAVVNNITVAKP